MWSISTWSIATWSIATWSIGTVVNINVAKQVPPEKHYHAQIAGSIHIPHNFDEACDDENWEYWQNIMLDELDSLNKHDVWDIVERPKDVKTIESKWVFDIKGDNENGGIRYKVRVVAAGYNQVKNKDYNKSYSPVVSIDTWRALMAIAAKKKLNIRFIDVKTVYLHDGKKIVYLEPSPKFKKGFENGKLCKLKRSLYGLPQSERN